MNRFPRVLSPPNILITPKLHHTIPHLFRGAVLQRAGYAEVVSEPRVRDEHIMQHVRRVPNVRYGQWAVEFGCSGGRFFLFFEQWWERGLVFLEGH